MQTRDLTLFVRQILKLGNVPFQATTHTWEIACRTLWKKFRKKGSILRLNKMRTKKRECIAMILQRVGLVVLMAGSEEVGESLLSEGICYQKNSQSSSHSTNRRLQATLPPASPLHIFMCCFLNKN